MKLPVKRNREEISLENEEGDDDDFDKQTAVDSSDSEKEKKAAELAAAVTDALLAEHKSKKEEGEESQSKENESEEKAMSSEEKEKIEMKFAFFLTLFTIPVFPSNFSKNGRSETRTTVSRTPFGSARRAGSSVTTRRSSAARRATVWTRPSTARSARATWKGFAGLCFTTTKAVPPGTGSSPSTSLPALRLSPNSLTKPRRSSWESRSDRSIS